LAIRTINRREKATIKTRINMKSFRTVTSISLFSLSLMNAPVWANDSALTSTTEASVQTEATASVETSAAATVQTQAEAAAKAAAEASAAASGSATAESSGSTTVNSDLNVKPEVQVDVTAKTEAEGSASTGEANGDGKIGMGVDSEITSGIDIQSGLDLGTALKLTLGGDKPQRPERPSLGAELSAEVRAMIEKVSAQKETLLTAQAELLVQMRSAAAAQREQLRENIKTQRQAWLEARHSLVIDTKARLAEIRAEFKNSTEVEAVITAAKEDARNRRD
jgi:hypothetical protein